MSIQDEFDAGEAAGMDPLNDIESNGGRAQTSLSSPWLRKTCPICGHTFRRDDYVRVNSDKTVCHDMPGLRCASEEVESEQTFDDSLAGEFMEGLNAGRHVDGAFQLPITRLLRGHPLLTASQGNHRPHRCVMCQHTFRPNEEVVICPCGRHPDSCLDAVHQDIFTGMVCLDVWVPGASSGDAALKICPVNNEKI